MSSTEATVRDDHIRHIEKSISAAIDLHQRANQRVKEHRQHLLDQAQSKGNASASNQLTTVTLDSLLELFPDTKKFIEENVVQTEIQDKTTIESLISKEKEIGKLEKALLIAIAKHEVERVLELIALEANVKILISQNLKNGRKRSTLIYYALNSISEKPTHLECTYVSHIITALILAGCPLNPKDSKDQEIQLGIGMGAETFLHKLVTISLIHDDFHPLLEFVLREKPEINAYEVSKRHTPMSMAITHVTHAGKIDNPKNFYRVIELLVFAGGINYALPIAGGMSVTIGEEIQSIIGDFFGTEYGYLTGFYHHEKYRISPLLYYSPADQEILKNACHLIFEDMARSCLQHFVKVDPHWSFQDLTRVMIARYSVHDHQFPALGPENSLKLINPVYVAHLFTPQQKAEHISTVNANNLAFFETDIMERGRSIVSESRAQGYYYGRYQSLRIPKGIWSIISAFSNNEPAFFNQGYEYSLHAALPENTNSQMLTDAIQSSEIIVRSFDAVVKCLESCSHSNTANVNAATASNSSSSAVALTIQSKNIRDTKSDNDKAQKAKTICFQFRYWDSANGAERTLRQETITLKPSARNPGTHTVLNYESEDGKPDTAVLIVSAPKTPAQNDKTLLLSINNRHNPIKEVFHETETTITKPLKLYLEEGKAAAQNKYG